MFSECNSSRVPSIDSYNTENNVGEASQGLEDLVAELASTDEASTYRSSLSSRSRSATSSIISGLSFSSDDDFFRTLEEKDAALAGIVQSEQPKKGAVTTTLDCAQWLKENRDKTPARRTRSAMGTYIPPPGGQPLTRSYFASPGPAKYYPNIRAVKPNAPEYLLKSRPKQKSIGDLGPGPGAFMLRKSICPEKYIESHFAKRFPECSSVGPGPGAYDLNAYDGIGKKKPKARLVGRRRSKIPTRGARIRNICGMTRFGRFCGGHALIISKPLVIDKREPGPGAYDPQKIKDRRIGIKMRGRPKDNTRGLGIPGPKYNVPSTLRGPSWPLVGKWKDLKKATDSPGPIYDLTCDNKKPVSMTFRPFPVRGKEAEPSPLSYKDVGEQNLKTKPSAPTALIVSRRSQNYNQGLPGPQYLPPGRIGFSSYNQCSMKGRWKFRTSIGPGPGQYKVGNCVCKMKRPPICIFALAQQPKDVNLTTTPERSPGFVYTPKFDRGTIRNVYLAPRWKGQSRKDNTPFYDVSGYTRFGGKAPTKAVAFKGRQSPFVFNGTSTNACYPHSDTCDIQRLKFDPPTPVNQRTLEKRREGRLLGKAIDSLKTGGQGQGQGQLQACG